MDAHIFKCLVFKNNAQKIDSKTSQSVHEYVFKNTRSHLFKLENMRLIKVTKNGLVHLLAEVDVNGDINDVWFLTSVLTEMTKTLPVTVRLKDSDGEFLLIQCAEFLTDEIIPENSKNRVFLVDGEIKIVNQLVLEKNDLVKKDEKFFSLSLQTVFN